MVLSNLAYLSNSFILEVTVSLAEYITFSESQTMFGVGKTILG